MDSERRQAKRTPIHRKDRRRRKSTSTTSSTTSGDHSGGASRSIAAFSSSCATTTTTCILGGAFAFPSENSVGNFNSDNIQMRGDCSFPRTNLKKKNHHQRLTTTPSALSLSSLLLLPPSTRAAATHLVMTTRTTQRRHCSSSWLRQQRTTLLLLLVIILLWNHDSVELKRCSCGGVFSWSPPPRQRLVSPTTTSSRVRPHRRLFKACASRSNLFDSSSSSKEQEEHVILEMKSPESDANRLLQSSTAAGDAATKSNPWAVTISQQSGGGLGGSTTTTTSSGDKEDNPKRNGVLASAASASSGMPPAAAASSAVSLLPPRRHRRRHGGSSTTSSRLTVTQGLSKFHQSILSRRSERQCFVTGRYPLTVTVVENPTRKWLRWTSSSSRSSKSGSTTATSHSNSCMELRVNGTTVERSLASLDRFQWLDDDERDNLLDAHAMVSMEFLAEVHLNQPVGYVQVLESQGAGSTAAFWQRLRRCAAAAAAAAAASQHHGNNKNKNNNGNGNAILSTKWQQRQALLLAAQQDGGIQELMVRGADRLWVTGFSLAGRQGVVQSFDVDNGCITSINDRSRRAMLWPNEVTPVPARLVPTTIHKNNDNNEKDDKEEFQDALLVSDGFLVPGKDRGGLYLIQHPGNPQTEWTVCLAGGNSNSNNNNIKSRGPSPRRRANPDGIEASASAVAEPSVAPSADDRWFYHRATWIDMTGDGRQSILTAKCQVATAIRNNNKGVTSGITKQGQLVWLECPQPHRMDPATGTPLDEDGTEFDPFAAKHLPWKEHVLATGPDVMFCIAQLNDNKDDGDRTIEVLSSQFFGRKVVLHSIQLGRPAAGAKEKNPTLPRIVLERVIDDDCGAAFGCILADLDGDMAARKRSSTGLLPKVVDSGSTVPTLRKGDAFSHLLVTSHERSYKDKDVANNGEAMSTSSSARASSDGGGVTTDCPSHTDGGSLFAYRVPRGNTNAWKTEPWIRTTIATGFKVSGQLSNMINPGAPGFVYTFHAKKTTQQRPKSDNVNDERGTAAKIQRRPMIAVAGDCAEAAYLFRPSRAATVGDNADLIDEKSAKDPSALYKLMVEIHCGATVGSIGVGYDDFLQLETQQQSGYAKLYLPCYEKNKILVFALGSGDESVDEGWI